MRDKLSAIIKEISDDILKKNGEKSEIQFSLVIPENANHGDFACNAAMQLTRVLRQPPRDIAANIIEELEKRMAGEVSCEIAGPGFINITISKEYFRSVLLDIISDDDFFTLDYGKKKKVLVEYVSANPTGPLHIGHGRGAAYGDSLARVLKKAGYDVSREYYVNDAGNQMNNLAMSVFYRIAEIVYKDNLPEDMEFPENGYKGDYIIDIAKDLLEKNKKILEMDRVKALDICLEAAVKAITAMIEKDLKDFRVNFDNWYSEKSLYKTGKIDKVLKKLDKTGKLYEKDGALWLKTTDENNKDADDKDRVLKKSTGEYTYFTPDIAYHEDKYDRGYQLLVDIWGSDHHGYIKRMQRALSFLHHDADTLEVPLIQMVNLVKGGKKISMSTRSGDFIPLSYLIDEVGIDAARFFYNMRSHDAQFDFDIDLAASRSNDNPVYYIQYAHARLNSLFNKAEAKGIKYKRGEGLEVAIQAEEVQLIKQMLKFKYVIELSAIHLEPHRIAYYLQDLASAFHTYYYNNQILFVEDEALTSGKLTMCEALKKVLHDALDLLGVTAPLEM